MECLNIILKNHKMENLALIQPLQFSVDLICKDDKLTELDRNCFSEIALTLKKHNRTHRFGITFTKVPFLLNENEVLVEYTDIQNRKQLIRPEINSGNLNVIETNWSLKDGSFESMLGCIRYCANNVHGNHDSFHRG